MTQAGHIVQAVAESLFGAVIHQLRRPGAPFSPAWARSSST